MARFIPIILAGGKGERFWPVSRLKWPKQFLRLDGSQRSLLQSTADRLLPLAPWESLFVITASHLAEGVRAQLPEIPPENILVEPQGRDTAPAVAWATLEVAKRYGEEVVCGFFPADHYITDRQRYCDTLRAAADLAVREGAIATLSIHPTFPSTGYGYIEQGPQAGTFSAGIVADLPAYKVSRFTEKPDQETAEGFLKSGRYSWNSGIFIFPAAVMIAELETYAPEMTAALKDKGVDAYATLKKLSIDYAVMEKTDRAYVMPANFGWDDLGDWNAIERMLTGKASEESTPENKTQVGDAQLEGNTQNNAQNIELCQHLGLDTQGSILYSADANELIVTIGLEDVVVVRDGNATLIVKKDRTQDIKQIVKTIGQDDRFKHLL
ncbi:MAG: mannose-1-phosphate guanylyltransferase [Leptolyngbya foveolarum]|uniref:Mannose-1-phosphate guanylyltransferase n=1 Tax=Leptolyngbya foveolarum TaxID=47253 RepID=A0A2W4W0K5_9CYAN|nr:MAG: mannose-1-phosphate guanylyltransferase [Leptolyngbya foveolarum]